MIVIRDATLAVETGTLAVVPALVPHDLVNKGDTTLRVLGIFSSNTMVSVFDHTWQPIGSRIVGTPMPEAS